MLAHTHDMADRGRKFLPTVLDDHSSPAGWPSISTSKKTCRGPGGTLDEYAHLRCPELYCRVHPNTTLLVMVSSLSFFLASTEVVCAQTANMVASRVSALALDAISAGRGEVVKQCRSQRRPETTRLWPFSSSTLTTSKDTQSLSRYFARSVASSAGDWLQHLQLPIQALSFPAILQMA